MKFTDMAASESKYLKSADLQGQAVQVTIDKYSHEELEEQDGTKKQKWVVWFKGKDKGLVLNVTNANTLGELFEDSEAAKGKDIVLFSVQTPMGAGIRVRSVETTPDAEIPF